MRVGIYYYEKAMKDASVLAVLQEKCREKGLCVSLFTDTSKIENVDVLIVLGGDGTMLPAAIECGKKHISVVGINYGHLGFLTQFEQSRAFDVVDLLAKNQFDTEKRSVLSVNIHGNTFYALNEIVVQRHYDDSFHRLVIGLFQIIYFHLIFL